jgi:hypothetical protein
MILGFFFILFISFDVHSGGLFNHIINNLSNGGHLCGRASRDDVADFVQILRDRQLMGEAVKRNAPPPQLFEMNLYSSAKQLFSRKSDCIKDYSEKIILSRDALNEIRLSMISIWLNKKKAALILNECSLYSQALNATISPHLGSLTGTTRAPVTFESLKKKNPRLNERFFETCLNNNQMSALRTLIMLADRSVPGFSNSELMNVMENNRAAVIFLKTQKPLTDAELLEIDLTSDEVEITISPPGRKKINQEISFFLKNKSQSMQTLAQKVKSSSYNSELFQELYDEETIDEIFHRAGLSPSIIQQNPQFDRLVSCMRADYETSFLGTTLDYISLFLIARRSLGLSPHLKNLAPLYSNSLAVVLSSTPTILNNCSKKFRIQDYFSGQGSQQNIHLKKSQLPKGLDLDLFTLEAVPLDSISSCVEHGYDRMFIDKSSSLTCIEEAALSLLPLSLGLGYSLSSNF